MQSRVEEVKKILATRYGDDICCGEYIAGTMEEVAEEICSLFEAEIRDDERNRVLKEMGFNGE